MVFPIVGGNQSTGDFVTNSLRFDDGDGAYLTSGTLSSPNTDKFTVSFWVKISGARANIFSIGQRLTGEAGDYYALTVDLGTGTGSGRLSLGGYNGVADSNTIAVNTAEATGPVFRDSGAWQHHVYAFDTGQGTAGNRLKWYVNGVLQSSYTTTTTPSQNVDLFSSSGTSFRIGRMYNDESRYMDGYLAEFYYVDGQQYDHTYFGEFNDNGIWVPVKKGTGAGGAITFGTNGFYLQFQETGTSANASGMGADTSGNGNHLTPSNLAALDVVTDTPQNNFATLNSIFHGKGSTVLSQGNCKFVGHNGGSGKVPSTMGITSGKWYAEFKITNTHKIRVGITDDISIAGDADGLVNDGVDFGWNDGYIYTYLNGSNNDTGAGSSSSGVDVDNPSANDILGVALDADNDTVRFYVNNTAQGSEATVLQRSTTANAIHFFHVYDYSGSGDDEGVVECNFGNSAFSISSGNTDANGYGNFEFEPPSGFYALCSKNLAEYG